MGFPIIEVEEEQVSPDRPSCVPPFCVFFIHSLQTFTFINCYPKQLTRGKH